MADPHTTEVSAADLRCCCGRTDCAFLKHSSTVLASVEKDVHTAARLGQTLLERHEAYMAHAEQDRVELTGRIEQLEMDKKGLAADIAKKEEENDSLHTQLDLLNTALADSDTRIKALEATLQSSKQTIRQLEGAESRAQDMERQLIVLETEQAHLQNTLLTSESDARSALQRWRTAERDISHLQEQLDKMEKEVEEERERHAEVMARMERQRAMEKDLNTAAGRLKGAAAAKSFNDSKGGPNVVSHFVRDLLQDNANLQLGIAELREMLLNSNDEIQSLRDQLLFHQPLVDGDASAASTLRAELEPASPQRPERHSPSVSQELHIHHHYHVSNKADPKRAKKKRQALSAGIFTPPVRTPSTPPTIPWRNSRGNAAPALLSHAHRDSLSTSSGPSNRWSVFSDQPSEFAPSSVPSSPLSNPRNSMFDRGFIDLSTPTSPTTSVDPLSPSWRTAHRKQASETSIAAFPIPVASFPSKHNVQEVEVHASGSTKVDLDQLFDETSLRGLPKSHEGLSPISQPTVTVTPSVSSGGTTTQGHAFSGEETPRLRKAAMLDEVPTTSSSPQRPSLHRAVSHESIMSLGGGLDIHTLRMRPSQLSLRPLGATAADTGLSAITARPTISRGSNEGKRGSVILRDSLSLGLPAPRTRVISSPSNAEPAPRVASGSGKFGRLVSWRLWNGSGNISITPTRRASLSPAPESPTTPTTIRTPGKTLREKDLSRAAGINQPGSIPGFYEYWAAHQRRGPASKVLPEAVDQDALREILDDA